MFEVVFQSAFSNCLVSVRNIYAILLQDLDQQQVDANSLIMRTVSPQYSVSLFEFDALNDEFGEQLVARQMIDRIRNLTSKDSIDESRKPLSNIYFAASILEDSILVIYNAENLTSDFYQALEKVEVALRASGKGRLRLLLIGSEQVLPLLARHSSDFKRIKWYNLLEEPDEVSQLLEEIRLDGLSGTKADDAARDSTEDASKQMIYFGRMM